MQSLPSGTYQSPFETHSQVVQYWNNIINITDKQHPSNYPYFVQKNRRRYLPKNHEIFISHLLKKKYFKSKATKYTTKENEYRLISKWLKAHRVTICHVLHKKIHPLIIEYVDNEDDEPLFKWSGKCFQKKCNKEFDTCALCLEDLQKETQQLKCNHVFHTTCLRQIKTPQCPLCRSPI